MIRNHLVLVLLLILEFLLFDYENEDDAEDDSICFASAPPVQYPR